MPAEVTDSQLRALRALQVALRFDGRATLTDVWRNYRPKPLRPVDTSGVRQMLVRLHRLGFVSKVTKRPDALHKPRTFWSLRAAGLKVLS